jgi:hypothetical protein
MRGDMVKVAVADRGAFGSVTAAPHGPLYAS